MPDKTTKKFPGRGLARFFSLIILWTSPFTIILASCSLVDVSGEGNSGDIINPITVSVFVMIAGAAILYWKAGQIKDKEISNENTDVVSKESEDQGLLVHLAEESHPIIESCVNPIVKICLYVFSFILLAVAIIVFLNIFLGIFISYKVDSLWILAFVFFLFGGIASFWVARNTE